MEQTIYKNNYSLSIRFFTDGFSLFVYDQFHTIISQKNIISPILSLSETEILEILSKENEFQGNYVTIRIIYESSIYTFIPNSFFKITEQKQVLEFLHPNLSVTDTVIYNKIEPWSTIVVFAIYNPLYNVLQQLIPEIAAEHHLCTFLTDYIALRNDTSVHVWVRSEDIDIIAIRANSLLLINSFKYSTTEDFTYFILQVFDNLKLDTEKNRLVLYNVGKRIELKNSISRYVIFCENFV